MKYIDVLEEKNLNCIFNYYIYILYLIKIEIITKDYINNNKNVIFYIYNNCNNIKNIIFIIILI